MCIVNLVPSSRGWCSEIAVVAGYVATESLLGYYQAACGYQNSVKGARMGGVADSLGAVPPG